MLLVCVCVAGMGWFPMPEVWAVMSRIRLMALNPRDYLHYDVETGAWDINQPPDPDDPIRSRRMILAEIEARGIVATPDALSRIALLPERMEFRDDE